MMRFGNFRKRIFVAILFLAVVLGVMASQSGVFSRNSGVAPADVPVPDPLPFKETVLSLIQPLQYSAFPAMLSPEAVLEVDFSERTWTLRNFRKYNEKGELLLPEGRYGLCAELTAYVFQHLKPLLGERYLLEFARATEPNFFDTLQSNHIVLVLSDRTTGKIYLIDPSFHRYGERDAFPDYRLHGIKDVLGAVARRDRDVTFSLDGAVPLLLRGDSLIAVSVEPGKDVLDTQNIILAVSTLRRSSTSGEYLFAVRKQAGEIKTLLNASRDPSPLTPQERALLEIRFSSWLQDL